VPCEHRRSEAGPQPSCTCASPVSQAESTTFLRPVSFSAETPTPPLGDNPLLRSGLALAGINVRRSGESDDGFLAAAEAAELALPGDRLTGDGAGAAENNR
jgi:hypothetical protein